METNNNNILPELPTGEELEEQAHYFLHEDQWLDVDVADELLDVTQDYPIRYSLSINGTPFAPLGGIHGMTGQPGHGKTMTLSMLAAAVLGDKSHGMEWLLTEDIPNPSVLYIDTEMEKGNTMLVNKRICAMLGWDFHTPHDNLTILCLREVVSAELRWKKVLKAIYLYKPTVVILDGLIDVVADFNDNTDCQELISKCMATASHYGISLWLLLHENPGSTKMVGHAGSFLERKASDVMVTKKSKDAATGDITFELTNKKVRAKDWQGYMFMVDDSVHRFGVPRLVNDEGKNNQAAFTKEQLREWLTEISMIENYPEPFKLSDLKISLGGISGIKLAIALQQMTDEAKKSEMITPQSKREMEKGQTHPKWYFNRDNLNPFTSNNSAPF